MVNNLQWVVPELSVAIGEALERASDSGGAVVCHRPTLMDNNHSLDGLTCACRPFIVTEFDTIETVQARIERLDG